jgi:hypothetical protein
MRSIKLVIGCVALLGLTICYVASQPLFPDSGVTVLRNVKWRMTEAEVRKVLGNKISIKTVSDTVIQFDEELFEFAARYELYFLKDSKELIYGKISLEKKDQHHHQVLIERFVQKFGKPSYQDKKEEGIAHLEIHGWNLPVGRVQIVHFSAWGRKTLELFVALRRPKSDSG